MHKNTLKAVFEEYKISILAVVRIERPEHRSVSPDVLLCNGIPKKKMRRRRWRWKRCISQICVQCLVRAAAVWFRPQMEYWTETWSLVLWRESLRFETCIQSSYRIWLRLLPTVFGSWIEMRQFHSWPRMSEERLQSMMLPRLMVTGPRIQVLPEKNGQNGYAII